jgi:hypothetical protein
MRPTPIEPRMMAMMITAVSLTRPNLVVDVYGTILEAQLKSRFDAPGFLRTENVTWVAFIIVTAKGPASLVLTSVGVTVHAVLAAVGV